MPTYRFYNKNTKTEFEEYMSIADMEKFTKKKHIKLMPPTQMNIVSSTGSVDSKTDSGWKDVLGKISDAHPRSELAKRYRRKSTNEVKVDNLRQKHKRIRAGKK
tara:strand:+ start:154 stop:465 length:312 start_codon:yes stop_codon:yes gene_type:complete